MMCSRLNACAAFADVVVHEQRSRCRNVSTISTSSVINSEIQWYTFSD
jgi:hypothetical protein